ncbi:MAG: HAD family hydrolase [Saccharofermentans sp.]|nr:HAD family hydrolase [Saccharofermentans sp.]
MIKAVIFDMFETLVSIFSGDTYFSEHIAADLNIPIEDFRPVWRATDKARSSGQCTIAEVMKICLETLGCYSEESVQLIVDHRRENLEGVFARTPKETIELLEALKARNIKIGLISNCYSDEAQAIKESVLYPFFDAPVLSYEQGVTKPDPEIFRRAIDMLGVSADECLYVGDGGSKELYAARDAGMEAVQARYFAHLAYEPHIPCGRLDEFDQAETQMDVLKYL